MMIKYPCLVLDHDDTVVASTPTIHYPSFMQCLRTLRPEIHWTLEEFMYYNFEPGFEAMCNEMLGFTPAEMKFQEENWRQWAGTHHPPMFEGMPELLRRYKKAGGIICVVSHSSKEVIDRDYEEQCGFVPDAVFGWELGPEKRKPHPWPLRQIMEQYDLKPEQLLMVDDLKLGWKMASSCDVPFAFAGWGNKVPQIHAFMKANAEYYLNAVEELEKLVF